MGFSYTAINSEIPLTLSLKREIFGVPVDGISRFFRRVNASKKFGG
jgi:hypothetical protein